MKKIRVDLKRPYTIYIGANASLDLKKHLRSLDLGNYGVVITNKTVYSLYKSRIRRIFTRDKKTTFTFFVLPDTEKAKSFPSVIRIIDKVASASYKKRVFFVCLGGGVIGDLGAFIASIYKRGRPVVQIPTTLLSQIDSAIGGKTAIDVKVAKNLVGSFWQPSLVLNDLAFLKTLKASQMREGLAEAIKYGLIKDAKLFSFIERNWRGLLKKDTTKLLTLICRCAAIKEKVVEKDEREEKGLRTILNFGHTVGHALEASSGYRMSHGRAVALGMVASLTISQREGLPIGQKTIDRVTRLIMNVGLPVKVRLTRSKVLTALKKDKKFIREKTRMVLLQKLGRVVVKEGIPLSVISRGIKAIET